MAAMEQLLAAVVAGDAAEAVHLALADRTLLSVRGPGGATPILTALYHHQTVVADALAELKPELELCEAAALGDVQRVAGLISQEPGCINAPGGDGFAPLGLACFFGRTEVADLLLARGADANQVSLNAMRVQPLHSAVAGRHTAIVRMLLSHGADANARQQAGVTPLQAAARHGHLDMVTLLLEHGADPHQTNEAGETALGLAEKHGNGPVVELIRVALAACDPRPFGLICAIPEEIAHFGAHFTEAEAETLGGFTFRRGRLDGRAAVVVEAGIGKVNAAIVATLLLSHFGCRALLFSGVAGGLDPALGIGDVVVATRLIQHDYGQFVDGRLVVYQPGIPPLPGVDSTHGYIMPPDLEKTVRAALAGVQLPPMPAAATGGGERRPALLFGTVLTGDQFLNCAATRDDLFARFQAQAVEMEGASVAQVAAAWGVPVLVVRSLSDLAGAESHMDFPAFVRMAAAGAATVVRRLAAAI
ncbi:5'-methylthioadenosine/adenosylhomocysteine nucleosidase [Oleisolibacter albus]|uniref:5'-methylthioadenosine/adenosylhomocysteine nucleosidase n=1 Tax=Oleisolibacter albus TaxID=2171757 RepID=UPI00196061C8|nr:5'-methylthioadenosine/adenosylhomocysteine nucleosidase [Oleisolibacter albus]